MTLLPNSGMVCGGSSATLKTGGGSTYRLSVRHKPEVAEPGGSDTPYVVRRMSFLANTPRGVQPSVGDEVSFRGSDWRIGKVVHTPYCHHFGLTCFLPDFNQPGTGEPLTLKLRTVDHQHGCDAQDNPSAVWVSVPVIVLHNNSTETTRDSAEIWDDSWRIYLDNDIARTLDHDSVFEHQSNPDLFYKVYRMVDLDRFDRFPYALARLMP